MKWYLDTEFNEDGKTIELISLALVSEFGHEYYAHSADYDPEACNDWVKANVLPHVASVPRIPRSQIASEVQLTLLGTTEQTAKPELWGYFADYDWVVFCWLYGRMVDLPKGLPYYCRDLKQLMDERGWKKDQLPPQAGQAHNALADARWIRDAHSRIIHHVATRSVGPASRSPYDASGGLR